MSYVLIREIYETNYYDREIIEKWKFNRKKIIKQIHMPRANFNLLKKKVNDECHMNRNEIF